MEPTFSRQYSHLEKWHWWFRGRTKIVETLLLRELTPRVSHRILSVGSGPVGGLQWLLRFTGSEGGLIGIDVEQDHGTDRPNNIQFVVGTAYACPFADRSFDVVIALDVLEHVDDELAVLREIIRLAKPGGLIVITVPALPALWGRQDVVSHHRRRYTRRSLIGVLERVGVEQFEMNYFNFLLLPIVASIRLFRRMSGTDLHRQSDFESNKPGLVNNVLAAIFGLERKFINSIRIPVGVSLMVKFRKAAKTDTFG